MIKRIVLFIAFVGLVSNVFAQNRIREFSEDESKFLKQLKKIVEDSSNPDGKEVFKTFDEQWVANFFTDGEKANTRLTADLLLKKRAKSEHFANYLLSVISINQSQIDQESINEWQEGLEFMLQKRNFSISKVDQFLSSTYRLINNSYLYDNGIEYATKWTAHNADFTIEFKQDEVLFYFDTLDISCFLEGDSIHVFETSGHLDPINNDWYGQGGKVYWTEVNLPMDSVYAELQDYSINLKRAYFEADSVFFTNLTFSKDPLLGKFENKILSKADGRSSYPRFVNYTSTIAIKEMFPGVGYEGSFSMYGDRFLSSAQSGEEAVISFVRNDTVFMKCYSSKFVVNDDQITSPRTRVVVYLDQDSIFHPGLSMRYSKEKNEVNLFRTDEGISNAPFFNSYHQLDMDFEQITWKVGEPRLLFTSIKGGEGGSAVFESAHYFSRERYLGLMGYDQQHPFTGLIKFYNEYHEKQFSAAEYAQFIRMPITPVRQQLMTLSYLGVIDYHVEKELITLQDRLFYYVKAVSGVVDYDVMVIVSSPNQAENASLNLLNNDLRIHGVPTIQLSDSQNVKIFPYQGEIVMKKNRDFEFNGKVEAGKFDFYGKTFLFSYEDFKIDLPNIDSLRIWVEKKGPDGMPELHRVKTPIQDITGDLLIDRPQNKSGRLEYPEYPIFNSKRTSYVYYDNPGIQKGVYRRYDFYFMIDPYQIDSLDVFKSNSLAFDGEFFSANIFPPFRESLTVQPDMSLGFYTRTPDNGYPTYVDKGLYFNDIHLSHRGLRGIGKLNYLTSTSECDDFIFYPDSMNAFPQTFAIAKSLGKPQYPKVESQKIYQHWEPYLNQLYVQSGKTPFMMYDEASMTGALRLRPEILEGQGKMEFERATMESKDFAYQANVFDALSSTFHLMSKVDGIYDFKVDDVKAKVDFAQRKGNFELNNDSSFIDLPPMQYMVSMDMFDWYMDKEEIDLMVAADRNKNKQINTSMDAVGLADSNDEGAEFISTHPKQHALSFYGIVANYKLGDYVLSAQGVKSIPVADARILPGDGMVTIDSAAVMRTLSDARILADMENRYHLLFDAIVDITSKKYYQGNANYNYRDLNNRDQKIHFDIVSVNDSLQTYADGVIVEESNFTLSPFFKYKGDVHLLANRQFLRFDGGTSIIQDCPNVQANYLAFDSEIDPLNVAIPVPTNPKNIEGKDITAGIYITKDSTHMYSSFLGLPKSRKDECNISAEGWMVFDPQFREYVIASKEKISNPDIPGNLLRYKVDQCIIEAEGKIDLGLITGQVKIESAGVITHDLTIDSLNLDLMMTVDYYLPNQVMDIMVGSYLSNAEMQPADLTDEIYTKALYEFVEQKEADELMRNLSLYGSYKGVPKELRKTLVITNVHLIWDTDAQNYVSEGSISIGNIDNSEINLMAEGILEFTKTRTKNEFILYLELGYSGWYYFEYRRNNLFVVSSYDDFNFTLKGLDPDKRRNEIDGEPPLTVIPANDRKRRYLLEKYNMDDIEDVEDDD